MKVILGHRNSGKTTELIRWALEEKFGEPRYIVCSSQREAENLWHHAQAGANKENGPAIRFPLTLNELEKYSGYNKAIFAIDNLDIALKYIFPKSTIEIVTINT